jgi:signal transduction histidine kinase
MAFMASIGRFRTARTVRDSPSVASVRRHVNALRAAFGPRIRPLPKRRWKARHRFVLGVVWFNALIIGSVVEARGATFEEALAAAGIPGIPALAAVLAHTRRGKSAAATLGLLAAGGIVFHATGGSVVAFLHLFFVACVLSAYRDWFPFGFAVVAICVHDGLVGWLLPGAPLLLGLPLAENWMAVVLLGLVVGFGVGLMTVAVVTERERVRAERYYVSQGRWALAHQLELAESFKDDLLAMVSHELRTPLAAITGFSHTLLDREDAIDPEKRRDMMERILRNSGRLDRLMQNLLGTRGRWRIDPTATADVDEIISKVVQDIELSRDDSSKRNVRLVGFPSGVSARMPADALQLVLSNLVDNAVRFGHRGTEAVVQIEHQWQRALPDGVRGAVVIRVTNDGTPIPPADAERIFEPFVQLDSSARRVHPGVGLGLHVVRRVVEGHGGVVELRCGHSTVTFEVALPVCVRAPVEESPPTPTRDAHGGTRLDPFELSIEPAPSSAAVAQDSRT